jgi:5S rRNA maturation endonuclease (ribonuclease M5)/biotin operon repressor
MADLFLHGRQNGAHTHAEPARRIVQTYDYTDVDGRLLYQNVRYEPKTFRVRRPDGNGGWLWSLGEVRRVVYRLHELAEQAVVYLVEGEKDADRLWSLGLPATTAAAGAESWRDDYAEQIARAGARDVLLIPDNDEPGMKFARAATDSLTRRGLRVTLVRLPGLPPVQAKHGADISDWLDAGHSRQELMTVVDEALRLGLSKLPRPLSVLFTVPPRKPTWLVENLIRERANGWIGAGAKVGKSYSALDLLIACALGRPWLEHFAIARPLTVVLIEEEDDEWRIYDRVTKLCAGRGVPLPDSFHVTIRAGYRLDDEEALAPLMAWFQDYRPDLIVWDVFNRLHLKDERKPDQIMPVLWRLDQLRNEIGCANLLAHHSRKAGPTGPDLASGGQRLRGPSEFWGWAENSLYLSPLKGKGNIVVEPESKDAIVEPFKAHLEDVGPDARRWIYDGTVQARVDRGNETRQRIIELLTASPQTAEQIADTLKITSRTVKAHLRTLESEGLAESVTDPGTRGRKVWLASLGAEGVKSDDGVK